MQWCVSAACGRCYLRMRHWYVTRPCRRTPRRRGRLQRRGSRTASFGPRVYFLRGTPTTCVQRSFAHQYAPTADECTAECATWASCLTMVAGHHACSRGHAHRVVSGLVEAPRCGAPFCVATPRRRSTALRRGMLLVSTHCCLWCGGSMATSRTCLSMIGGRIEEPLSLLACPRIPESQNSRVSPCHRRACGILVSDR